MIRYVSNVAVVVVLIALEVSSVDNFSGDISFLTSPSYQYCTVSS